MKQSLLALAGLVLLVGGLSVLPTPSARSQNGNKTPQDVNVVNTPSVNVANTPSVSVAGTPTVNVGNSPTVNAVQSGAWSVGLANGTSVAISNTPTVNANDLTDPGRNPAQVDLAYFADSSGGDLFNSGANTFTVPAGKRLVIDSVSALAYAPNSTDVEIEVTTSAGGQQGKHYLGGRLAPSPAIAPGYGVYPITRAIIMADPGSQVTIVVLRDSPPPANTGYYNELTISGHYVTLP